MILVAFCLTACIEVFYFVASRAHGLARGLPLVRVRLHKRVAHPLSIRFLLVIALAQLALRSPRTERALLVELLRSLQEKFIA